MPKLKSSAPKKAKQKRVNDELHKFKEGTLHSRSKKGPKVRIRNRPSLSRSPKPGFRRKTKSVQRRKRPRSRCRSTQRASRRPHRSNRVSFRSRCRNEGCIRSLFFHSCSRIGSFSPSRNVPPLQTTHGDREQLGTDVQCVLCHHWMYCSWRGWRTVQS